MGSLFGGKSAPPPAPTPPAPMPDSNSPAVLEARRKSAEAIMSRAGRSSTILSAGNTGGDNYGSTKLGA